MEGGRLFKRCDWLLRENRRLDRAEYCINLDGGEFEKEQRKRLPAGMQLAKKFNVDSIRIVHRRA